MTSPGRRTAAAAEPHVGETCTIPLRVGGDAECAAHAARAFSRSVGFDARQQWEISIAVSELATNVLKFAGEGLVRLCHVHMPREAIVVEASDHGAGIADVSRAIADGFSEGAPLRPDRARPDGQGLGVGLGSVHRMMHQVDIQSNAATGTRIIAIKFRTKN